MKMKEFGPPGGVHVPGAPLRSANDGLFFKAKWQIVANVIDFYDSKWSKQFIWLGFISNRISGFHDFVQSLFYTLNTIVIPVQCECEKLFAQILLKLIERGNTSNIDVTNKWI